MQHWLYTANTKLYDVSSALAQNEAWWPMNTKVAAGDQLFIYLTAPHKQIAYCCNVLETDLPAADAMPHCEAYFRQIPDKPATKPFMRIAPKQRFTLDAESPLALPSLKANGLTGMLMGPRKLENNPPLLAYILEQTQ